MVLFYLLALLPMAIGLFIWLKNERVVFWEWLLGCLAAMITAGAMHYFTAKSLTGDVETWSGTAVHVEYHTAWTETYQQMRTKTVGSGKNSRTVTYYTTEFDYHPEHWRAYLDFGSEKSEIKISHDYYSQIKREFGGTIVHGGKQSAHHLGGSRFSGDNNIYKTPNTTGFFRPVTQIKSFENRIKAARSVFSFAPPPATAKIFPYPANKDPFLSDRLLGLASRHIGAYDWDSLNARLGPKKFVNLILVGFEGDADISQFQESLWLGGKKNDLVLTYGFDGTKVTWARVFGWSESDVCKRNLESIILKGISRKGIFKEIEDEITANYVIKDWHKFDYLSIEPEAKHFVIYFFVVILVQGGLYIYFHQNQFSKDCLYNRMGRVLYRPYRRF
jgi:hypothetical protein